MKVTGFDMKSLELLRNKIEEDVFTQAQIKVALGSNAAVYGAIHRFLKKKQILRIRRGLYAFGDNWRKKELNLFTIANLIYGPSYVSTYSALSYYGLIPERVVETTSVNTKKTKLFNSELGTFRYQIIPQKAFSSGVESLSYSTSNFLMACPEKAILDLLYLSATKFTSNKNYYLYLNESLRIEDDDLKKLDKALLKKISELYRRKTFTKAVTEMTKFI